jgi:hypothetical protein
VCVCVCDGKTEGESYFASVFESVCESVRVMYLCVCVCVREREREREVGDNLSVLWLVREMSWILVVNALI